jgi:hypothetical protein
VIASSAFFVLDAILDWPVSNYDGSWSQWGQMAGSDAAGGSLNPDSPWRTDVPSRSEFVVYTYSTDPGPVFYTAATTTSVQVNDMTASGVFTASTPTAARSYRVQIDSTGGATDTFKWSQNGGTAWSGLNTAITGTAQAIGTEGLLVTFATTTGHTVNDRWDFYTQRPVEPLALDGSVCSSSVDLQGTTTYYPAGCTPLSPNSYAPSGNQIEEEDAVYFGAGGGSSGGSGGGPIAPGY